MADESARATAGLRARLRGCRGRGALPGGRRGRGKLRSGCLVVAAVLLTSAAASGRNAVVVPGDGLPSAVEYDGVPEVGALFTDGLQNPHGCTASVVRGDGPDIVVTAAHCVSGTGRAVSFAPGYQAGRTPFGVWQVAAAYADPRWISAHDPRRDYVFLVLVPQRRGGHLLRLRDAVRGNLLGTAPAPGGPVTVPAYVEGRQDRPITCTAPTYVFQGYPAFDCHGYGTGVSGAPFLTRSSRGPVVRGVIGGLHQGGCVESTSYASRFDAEVFALYRRAESGASPDTLPEAGGDGC